MLCILIFLFNVEVTLKFSSGYYAPSIKELNEKWLLGYKKWAPLNNSGATFGAGLMVKIGPVLTNSSIEYFRCSSQDGKRNLTLIPLDVMVSHQVMILPKFLYSYINAGAEFTFTKYYESVIDSSFEDIGRGLIGEIAIKFISTPNLSFTFSCGYRLVTANMADKIYIPEETMVNDSLVISKDYIRINTSGGFARISMNREFR